MDEFMQAAIDEARIGLAAGGIRIGSALVHRGRIVGRGHNRRAQPGALERGHRRVTAGRPIRPRRQIR
jgi:creatinine deaminase